MDKATEKRLTKMYNQLLEKGTLGDFDSVDFELSDLEWLCDISIELLKKDPMLLRVEAPINIVGDIHGQYNDMIELVFSRDDIEPRFLFLGDYVDRGSNSIETITYLLILKQIHPNDVFLLRGNHETYEISQLYGFYDECAMRYQTDSVWLKFNEVFEYLPIAAIVSDHIFCVHGGLSRELTDLKQIEELERPLVVPEEGLVTDLLWSDPDASVLWFGESERGTSFTYGKAVVDRFCQKHGFELICRGHQVVLEGFEFPFHPEQSVVTVFSAPNYCGDFGNRGAMMVISRDLRITFVLSGDEEDHMAETGTPGVEE